MKNVGLVLEGGGMRGVYTSGVLDFFIKNNFYPPYVIGVSMGSCNACSYISKQFERNKRVLIDYILDPRYLSMRNLIFTKSLFGMDFIFKEIPLNLDPFDFDAFDNSEQQLTVVMTNCVTGRPVYKKINHSSELLDAVKASSSLPFVSSIVDIEGIPCLDGGISDSIPVRKALEDGNEKLIVILTRNKNYRKKTSRVNNLSTVVYRKYNNLSKSIINRYKDYNSSLDFIEELEKNNKALVIRPSEPLTVDRYEKNPSKLNHLYDIGYKDAEDNYNKILEFLQISS